MEAVTVAVGSAVFVWTVTGCSVEVGTATGVDGWVGSLPPFILTIYDTKWFNVGWSDSTKSSSTGREKISLTSPIISACLTVSIPNSPSRSWSISMKSSGYPVCFTTTPISLGSISPVSPELTTLTGAACAGICTAATGSGSAGVDTTAGAVDVAGTPPVIFTM